MNSIIQNIINSISESAGSNKVYLVGELARCLYLKKESTHTLEFLISSANFNITSFYKKLITKISINREIYNTPLIYSFISGPYTVKIYLDIQFNPLERFGCFSIDQIHYDLSINQFIDPSGFGLKDLSSDPILIRSIKEEKHQQPYVLSFFEKLSEIQNSCICEEDLSLLSRISINFDDSIISRFLLKILNGNSPGNSLKKLIELYPNIQPVLLKNLINLSITENVPINEDFNVIDCLSADKLALIDSYASIEISETKHFGVLKLLFESRYLEYEEPKIRSVSVFSQDTLNSVEIMQNNSAYNTPCNPADCPDGLCCCSGDIYGSYLKPRCFNQVFISCYQDPSTNLFYPENGETFPDGCTDCQPICQDVYGQTGDGVCGNSSWSVNPDSCTCKCNEWDGGSPSSGICNLWCVDCGVPCAADYTIENVNNCEYNLVLTPGVSCCGNPSSTDIVFVLDFSSVMSSKIQEIKDDIQGLYDYVTSFGSDCRLGLVTFGQGVDSGQPQFALDLQSSVTTIVNTIDSLAVDGGGNSVDLDAVDFAANNYSWSSRNRIILLVSQETDSNNRANTLDESSVADDVNNIEAKVFVVDNYVDQRANLAIDTSGIRFSISSQLSDIWTTFDVNNYPSVCSCLTDSYNVGPIPIPSFGVGQDQNCSIAGVYLECSGDFVSIETTNTQAVCCSDLFCSHTSAPSCCGINCTSICNPSGGRYFSTLREAQDAAWCTCWESALQHSCNSCCCPDGVSETDPNRPCNEGESPFDLNGSRICCDCIGSFDDCCFNCTLVFENGVTKTRSQILSEIEQEWNKCSTVPSSPQWNAPDQNCSQKDECIVGEQNSSNPCDDAFNGCTSIKNPSVVALNNGTGLVAYESELNNSVIKIKQFKTSVKHKVFANRAFFFGRLQNSSEWTNGIAKLYYYDENVNDLHLSSADSITFLNGPLQRSTFQLIDPPIVIDNQDSYIQFSASVSDLVFPFKTSDDEYDIKWFLLDSEDADVLTGSWEDTSAEGSLYDIDENEVNTTLDLPPHIHNGQSVPVANPSIATAYNYQNSTENAQFVYLTYQAFEDSKWNIYLRQIRLSEYKRQNANDIPVSSVVSIQQANITETIYRILDRSDQCVSVENGYLVSRKITMEVLSLDGRDVLNNQDLVEGNWTGICSGLPDSMFPKRKVFVTFVHSAITNSCPDQFSIESLFYEWNVGTEFQVPVTTLNANSLFSFLKISSDASVDTGDFGEGLTVDDINVLSASVGVTYYNPLSNNWYVISDDQFTSDLKYKGIQVDEPISISSNIPGHCTNPVVKVSYDNNVFIAFEAIVDGVHQIYLSGTSAPSSSLPTGNLLGNSLDSQLNSFYRPVDFVFYEQITSDGINQLPDMFIDLNDIVHLVWQSNRNNVWEIFYASSNDLINGSFYNTRITNYNSRSLRPKIHGRMLDSFNPSSSDDNIYIVWHDDRNINWEIYMAYLNRPIVRPLFQQDQYLSAYRNGGYDHISNAGTLAINNTTDSLLCLNKLTLNFYDNRVNEGSIAFSLNTVDDSYAFSIPDTTSSNSWDQAEIDTWTYIGDKASSYTITSDEFDSEIDKSYINHIEYDLIVDSLSGCGLRFAFRASDIPNDPLAYLQWSNFSPNVSQPSGSFDYSDLNLPPVFGRYKQIKIDASCDIVENLTLTNLVITSQSNHMICISPQNHQDLTIDLSPEIRLDKYGNETVSVVVQKEIKTNQTYFITAVGEDLDGNVINLGQLSTTISCEQCSENDLIPWNSLSCSVQVNVPYDYNAETDSVKFVNLRFRFFADKNKEFFVNDFFAFPNEDLGVFSIENNIPASSAWSVLGYPLLPDQSLQISCWPSLSKDSGLICGVRYWVEIAICSSSDNETICSHANLLEYKTIEWVCQCESSRWDQNIENAPVNILNMSRWVCSGNSKNDTRITAVSQGNNIAPIIQIRSTGEGVICYLSDRDSSNLFSVFASLFRIKPLPGMYSSAAQNIDSTNNIDLYKSDIRVRVDDNNISNSQIQSRKVDFCLDLYDNLFLAYQVYSDQQSCMDLLVNNQSIVKVHRCGAFPDSDSSTPSSVETCSDQIFDLSYVENDSILANNIVRQIKVIDENILYSVTRNQQTIPVVNTCKISLEIVGTPECHSIRLKNELSDWSEWIPFKSEIGDYTILYNWQLSSMSGEKKVIVQAASYLGLTQQFSISIFADYSPLQYSINLYKPEQGISDPLSDEHYKPKNLLPYSNNIPVASLGDIDPVTGSSVLSNFILIEIVPNTDYMQQFKTVSDKTTITPTFDFIQQGITDQYSIPTRYVLTDDKFEIFRGYIQLFKENKVEYIDGIASIIPYFINDCFTSVPTAYSENQFVKDKYNYIVTDSSKNAAVNTDDPFKDQRGDSGLINTKNQIRNSNEQPYFVFGESNEL